MTLVCAQKVRQLTKNSHEAVRVCVHPLDQNLVAVCCADGSLQVFNLTLGDTDGQCLQLGGPSIHAAFTPAGDWMLIAKVDELLAYQVPDTSYWDPEASKGVAPSPMVLSLAGLQWSMCPDCLVCSARALSRREWR